MFSISLQKQLNSSRLQFRGFQPVYVLGQDWWIPGGILQSTERDGSLFLSLGLWVKLFPYLLLKVFVGWFCFLYGSVKKCTYLMTQFWVLMGICYISMFFQVSVITHSNCFWILNRTLYSIHVSRLFSFHFSMPILFTLCHLSISATEPNCMFYPSGLKCCLCLFNNLVSKFVSLKLNDCICVVGLHEYRDSGDSVLSFLLIIAKMSKQFWIV